MKRNAMLKNTTSMAAQPVVGKEGTLERLSDGRWQFKTTDGKKLTTSCSKEGTLLGNLDVPACKSIHFETNSGSSYDFDLIDATRVYGY